MAERKNALTPIPLILVSCPLFADSCESFRSLFPENIVTLNSLQRYEIIARFALALLAARCPLPVALATAALAGYTQNLINC